MREAKYQAWDNIKNRMRSVGEESDIHFELTSGGIVAYDLNEEQDSPKYKMEHLKYRQYTGLKDKNGVEVYEGDVSNLNLKDYADDPDVHKFVIKDFPYDLAYLYTVDEFIKDNETFDYIEVIGNIYENPELLEGEAE